jgi:hypothetical protein
LISSLVAAGRQVPATVWFCCDIEIEANGVGLKNRIPQETGGIRRFRLRAMF